jgi:molecular chaperone GrpE (heat shock protein)
VSIEVAIWGFAGLALGVVGKIVTDLIQSRHSKESNRTDYLVKSTEGFAALYEASRSHCAERIKECAERIKELEEDNERNESELTRNLAEIQRCHRRIAALTEMKVGFDGSE